MTYEIGLAAAKLKVKAGGGDAGNNGARSITATLGPDYRRVRSGISHPGEKHRVHGHVLGEIFSKADEDWLVPMLSAIAEAAPMLANDDDVGFAEQGRALDQAAGKKRKAAREGRVMGFKCGIVELPNCRQVHALPTCSPRQRPREAANYPFCTIEPNVGDVAVPDPRLEKLAAIAKSAEIIPTRITFVDIAGLVRGASKGEGLGNQFLANIREVDAVVHVLRCFEDDDITHVEGKIDPVGDAETVETELMLADLRESLEKRASFPSKRRPSPARKRSKEQLAADDEGARASARRQSLPGWQI